MTEPALLPSILLADDDPDDLFFACRLMTKARVKNPIITVQSSDQAIAYLRTAMDTKLLPCVVFLDVKMPGRSGFDILQWIRSQAPLRTMPVVMFSSSPLPRDRGKAEELGATWYFTKFPSPDEFRDEMTANCPLLGLESK